MVYVMFFLSLFAQEHFAYNSSKPLPTLIDKIQELCSDISKSSKLIIEAHADQRGSDVFNLKLTKKRAEEAAQLIKDVCRFDKEIVQVPMGKFFPQSKEHSENRRIVIHMIRDQVKTITIYEKEIQQQKLNWQVKGLVVNNDYNLATQQTTTQAIAELQRQWSGGILIEKRVYDNWYLGGGAIFSGQYILSLGKGF